MRAPVCVCVCVCVCASVPACAYLQRGEHYPLNRVEVGIPEELCLLPEREDLILVDGAHRGRDLVGGGGGIIG